MIQWLGLYASLAKGMVSIPGGETEILKVVWHGQKKKKYKEGRKEEAIDGGRDKNK